MRHAVVIGGGFYGTAVASYLANRRGFSRITIVEREERLLARASFNNQARVHNGYHYPRSYTTAYRSRLNLPRFLRDFPDVVSKNFTKVYAIARRNSKVTGKQFERFCYEIGARLSPAPASLARLFEPSLIETAYVVEEYGYDALRMREWAERELKRSGVEVLLRTQVTSIRKSGRRLSVAYASQDGPDGEVDSRWVFNCTYSGLNQLNGDFRPTRSTLKHELTELALVVVPPELERLGITVLDGSYFSIMPFPPRELHTLSHVRYTPHCQWRDEPGHDPYSALMQYDKASHFDRMVRDAGRYVPTLLKVRPVDSLFEVKTVLEKNEGDDGRPILFERCPMLPNCFSILGGKIDNIYDVLEKLDQEDLALS